MNRHGYKVLLQSWFGTESGLMIGSEKKIHGWGLESFEPTSYPQTGPGHFCWFSQQNFQDRALARQLSSKKPPWPFLESPIPEQRDGGELLRAHSSRLSAHPEAVMERARLGELGREAQTWEGLLGPQIIIEHFLKGEC